ncbi:MAG: single-stranded DNA-binding protein [Puniceicoccaceae bacterium]
MNQSVLSGYLTADIETREFGENHVSTFTVACNQGEKTTFLPVEAWNMEHLSDYLGKGSKVLVSGSLRQNQWETKEGEKRSRIVLNAYQVEFLDPPPEKAKGQPRSAAKPAQRGRRRAA